VGSLRSKRQMGEDGQLLIAVSDTGTRLLKEKAEQILDAFFTTTPQGSGMGLSISRSMVESHGGRLWPRRTTDGVRRSFHFADRSRGVKVPATGT
jgi:signal transduction histidine kinase